MKVTFASFAAVLALAGNVSGHYIFQQLSVGSTTYPVFQYIRRNTNYNSPVTGKYSADPQPCGYSKVWHLGPRIWGLGSRIDFPFPRYVPRENRAFLALPED